MSPTATETQFLVIGAWGQLLIALVLAAMLAWQYRMHPRPVLALWTAAFIALAIYVVGAAWSFGLAQRGAPVTHGWRLTAMVMSLAAAHAQLALLLLGTLRLARREPVPRRVLAITVGGCTVLGALLALSYGSGIAGAGDLDMLQRLAMLYVLQGLTWLLCGTIILLRRAPRGALGQRALGVGFAAFGTIKLALVATIIGGTPGTGEAPASALVVLIELLGHVAAGTGIALWLLGDERRRAVSAQAHVSTLLRFDPVTGLRNRAALTESWPALRGERSLLLVLVIEGVEQVDARLAGGIDKVLRALGGRLEEEYGAERVAQLDRARFAILASAAQTSAHESANAVLQTCEAALDRVAPQEELWPVVGVATATAGEDLAGQLARAAAACESARRLGGSRLLEADALTAPQSGDSAAPRLHALREAFAGHEFELHYQPQFDADRGGLHGFEALVRWRHPEAGLLLPGRFMDAIGRTGLARRLDALVVELACARLRKWLDAGLRPPPVAVNLCAESLADPELPEMLGDALVRHRVPTALLGIELTETAALADVGRCARVLGRLRAFGFAAALDDFGTGFSSLAHLRDLPVDTIKIDRRFVHGAVLESRDAALVRGLSALAASLGLRVVAEGVETAEQAAFARAAGIVLHQGWFYAPALPSDEAAALIARADATPAA